MINLYGLGTVCNGYRVGAVTFPFIDVNGQIRAIQVKQFDEYNHTVGTDFIHSMVDKFYRKRNRPLPSWLEDYLKNEMFVSCLFGEHLLTRYPNNPIALVEAPKTAIYGTLYYGLPDLPDNFLWLAVYNLSSLNFNKCQVLHGRDVFLFPDLSKPGAKNNCYELWSRKAEELNLLMPGTCFQISNLLENHATEEERSKGLDLADYLIKLNHQEFRQPDSSTAVAVNTVKNAAIEDPITPVTELSPVVIRKQVSFDKLKEKYPAIAVLVEKLEFEVVNFNTESDDALTVSKLAEYSNKIATDKMAIKGKEGERKC